MAGNWRIRHKLMLSMGLMVSVLALLLAGTLKGLASYRTTMRTIASKMSELEEADSLREKFEALTNKNLKGQNDDIETKIQLAHDAIARFKVKLEEHRDSRTDVAFGFLEALKDHLGNLQTHLDENGKPFVKSSFDDKPASPYEDSVVQLIFDKIMRTSADLNSVIIKEIGDRIERSRGDYRFTMGFVISTCIAAVLLMAGLLRFFYRWVCYPIRDLEAGVGRVAKGDFEHKIEVHSGDEIEDLAKAFNDMTGRLREMYRDLAQQVNERSKQLVRSERLAGVGFLAAGVAHEINNPLASIAFCSEALDQRLSDLFRANFDDTPGQERDIISKYLKMIQEEAFRCKEITQRLLAFSRSNERKREPTDLGELVQSVLDIVHHTPNCRGKQLVFQPAERITAWVNGQEIKQVFLNLVVNSLESMDEGGRLTILPTVKDDMVEIVFEDNGCGMTSEVLENIFEPFFTKSRTGKGTGLGLSISHRIITQHGGEIEAQSAGPNQGSTFRVRLPLKPATTMPNAADEPDPEEEFVKLSASRAA